MPGILFHYLLFVIRNIHWTFTLHNGQFLAPISIFNFQFFYCFLASIHRNTKNAVPLNTLRTAWSCPQRRNKRPARSELTSSSGLSNFLLVGKITISVKGITRKRRAPPISQPTLCSGRHARSAAVEPASASGACINVPRR